MKIKAWILLASIWAALWLSNAANICDWHLATTPFGNLCSKLVTKSEEIWAAFRNNTNQIHFIGWGEKWNNFWGFFVMESNPELAVPVKLVVDGWATTITCKNKLNGYYYSAARWNILFPTNSSLLDKLKQNNPTTYSNISMNWGFYSNCDDQYNITKKHNTIAWNINYIANSQPVFSLTAWRQYDLENNTMTSEDKLVWNFQLKDNAYPIGFFYDSDFWVSFLGWKILNWIFSEPKPDTPARIINTPWINTLITNLNNYPSKIDILDEIKEFTNDQIIFKDYNDGDYKCEPPLCSTTITIPRWQQVIAEAKKLFASLKSIIWADWIISFSDANTWDIVAWITQSKKLINTEETNNDIIVTKSNALNISDYLNKARTNAEILCRWKWINSANASNQISNDICIKDENNLWKTFNINTDLTQKWTPINIVIKSQKWFPSKLVINSTQVWNWYLNVFMDNWVLLFKNLPVSQLKEINSQGTLRQSGDWLAWYQWNMIRWNFAINWIMAWTDDWTNLTGINNRLFVDWTFGSLNTIGRPIWTRIELVKANLWDSDIWNNYENYISLTKIENDDWTPLYDWVLAWRCNTDSSNDSSDWTKCINDKISSDTTIEDLPYNSWYIRANWSLDSFLTK